MGILSGIYTSCSRENLEKFLCGIISGLELSRVQFAISGSGGPSSFQDPSRVQCLSYSRSLARSPALSAHNSPRRGLLRDSRVCKRERETSAQQPGLQLITRRDEARHPRVHADVARIALSRERERAVQRGQSHKSRRRRVSTTYSPSIHTHTHIHGVARDLINIWQSAGNARVACVILASRTSEDDSHARSRGNEMRSTRGSYF